MVKYVSRNVKLMKANTSLTNYYSYAWKEHIFIVEGI